MKKRMRIITSLIMVMAIVMSGCTSKDQAGETEALKEITISESWGFEEGYSTIFTLSGKNSGAITYLGNFYETLLDYKDGEIVPGLAESWEISEDGLTYTFHLKEGIKFSDGEVLDAAIVKKNFDMIPIIMGEVNGAYGLLPTLFKETNVVDEHTVEVHLTAPYYGALQDFSQILCTGIMSPNAFNEDNTLSDRLKTETLGTGAYMSAGESDGKTYSFVRNPNYHGEKPMADKFHVKVIPDNEARALALRNNEIDGIFQREQLTYEDFTEFGNTPGFKTKISEGTVRTNYFAMNPQRAPFDDIAVRTAVNHAINKENLCQNILLGYETKADTWVNSELPYCDVSLTPYEYDVEKAKNILEQAGWVDTDGDGVREKDGVALSCDIFHYRPERNMEDLVLATAADLEKIGMKVEDVRRQDFMAWYAETQEGDYSMVLAHTYGIPYDPFTLISNLNPKLHADYVAETGLQHLDNASELITELTTMTDEEEISKRYQYILQEINDNAVFVPVSEIKALAIFNSDKIEDYEFNSRPNTVVIAGIKFK